MLVRGGIHTCPGVKLIERLWPTSDHGVEQLFRLANLPSCDCRQSRTCDEPELSSDCIPAATEESGACAGSKMNARSFDAPSPLTSPTIIGVYRCPDCR